MLLGEVIKFNFTSKKGRHPIINSALTDKYTIKIIYKLLKETASLIGFEEKTQ